MGILLSAFLGNLRYKLVGFDTFIKKYWFV